MKRNNLDALRLVAAGLVLYGHSFALLGLREPLFLSSMTLGPLGVYIFFTISGYLVAESWDRDPNLVRFFARRGLRIFPGLAACVLLTVLVLGPALTTLPLAEYFASEHTRNYLRTIALYVSYYLPGVFATNPYPNAINGSLWSLPIEFAMYIVVAIVGLLGANRWLYVALAIGSAAMTAGWAWRTETMVVVYATDLRQVFICGAYFWVGAVFHKFGLRRWFSLSATLAAAAAMLCLEPWVPLLQMALWVLLPIVVLSFGFAHSPLLERLTRSGDYSYGIYIYAFPVQQTVAHLRPGIGIVEYLIWCTAGTLVLAVLSWHLVERRALALKPRAPRTGPQPGYAAAAPAPDAASR